VGHLFGGPRDINNSLIADIAPTLLFVTNKTKILGTKLAWYPNFWQVQQCSVGLSHVGLGWNLLQGR
jgi:hypothetical protein